MRKIPWEKIFVGICVLVLGLAVYKVSITKKEKKVLPVFPPKFEEEAVISDKEKAIIAQAKSYQVEITDDKINPQLIEVKLLDQVVFFNKTGSKITVKGKGWGGIPLSSGENMTQAFTNKGNFPYKIEGITVSLEGRVIVK